ncbi:hypothetical protein [Burkholderia plantarii]|uniref:hypothetical protein n=1 Tax=Burkholderia plantarii TaxID=41899 RepID=UPI000AE51F36|nr:hypothetical protein [Burkholderia plantarii]
MSENVNHFYFQAMRLLEVCDVDQQEGLPVSTKGQEWGAKDREKSKFFGLFLLEFYELN